MLENQVALVTGASRGIGREIALSLAQNGASVIVNYNGNKERADCVVKEIRQKGGEAEALQCDVADSSKTEEMIQNIISRYQRIDILVNNAGITKDMLMMKMSEEDFNRVIDINLKGTFHCIKHVSRQMLKQRSGRIINMSSVVGLSGNAGQINYAASKAGIIGITKSAAKELGSRQITVNAIAPGYIDTEMTQCLPDSVKDEIIKFIPLKKMGSTKDIASLVVYLASEYGAYITGQVISVDGGMHM